MVPTRILVPSVLRQIAEMLDDQLYMDIVVNPNHLSYRHDPPHRSAVPVEGSRDCASELGGGVASSVEPAGPYRGSTALDDRERRVWVTRFP